MYDRGRDHRQRAEQMGVRAHGPHHPGGERDPCQGSGETAHRTRVRPVEVRPHHHHRGDGRPIAVAHGQPGSDEIAERGHRRQADGVPEHGRVPAELTADRPDDDREQPEHGRAHQELGARRVGRRRCLVARAAAPGDLQRLGEQFHEPFRGLPGGPLQHLALLVDAQDVRAPGRHLGGSAAADRPGGRVQDVGGRVEQLPCAVPPGSLRRGADVRVGERGDDRQNALGEAPGAVEDGRPGAGL